MSQPFIAAQVLTAHHPLLRARVTECGNLFRFEAHVETRTDINRGIGLRVSCLCPEGHGVARRRWTGWLEPFMGRYDLVVADYTPATAESPATDQPGDSRDPHGAEILTLTVRPLAQAA